MNQILLQETEKVLNNAIASVEIEGYKLSDDEKKFIFFNSPEAVQQNKQKDVSIKNLMEEKRDSILSKLSDDEKDFISFQSFNEVFKMIKANEKEAKIQSYKNLKKNKP